MKRLSLLWVYIACLPFFVYSQTDTSEVLLYAWKLTDGFLIEPHNFDTTITYFQIMNPIEKTSISNSWLGNLGSAWKSNVYYLNSTENRSDFIFDNNFRNYGFSKDNQLFYYSKAPYFDINWTTSTKSRNENQLSALYTQNINKKLNVGMVYKLISSIGEFPNTLISHHSYDVFTSYIGKKYSLHATFIRNKYKNQESWGVFEDGNYDPEFAKANIETASSVYYDRSFNVSQQYKFGFTKKIVINDTTTESNFIEFGRLNHVFSFSDNYRVYKDDQPDSDLYGTIYNRALTKDSIHLAKIENSLYWTFKEIKRENFNGRLTVGATLENLKWNNFAVIDSVQGEDTVYYNVNHNFYEENFDNFKLMANLDARTKMFIFNVYGHYYMGSVFQKTNKANNIEANLLISKGIMLGKQKTDFYVKLKYASNSPTIFENHYESNHSSWNDTLSNVINTEARVGINIPAIKVKAEFISNYTENCIYFDTIPLQADKSLSVIAFSLKKDFKFGPFRSNNQVIFQTKTNYQT